MLRAASAPNGVLPRVASLQVGAAAGAWGGVPVNGGAAGVRRPFSATVIAVTVRLA